MKIHFRNNNIKKAFLFLPLMLPILSFSQGYEPSDIIVSLTATFSGDQPHSLVVNDKITGANLVNQTSYDLKHKSRGIGVSGSYFITEFISLGAYVNHSMSKVDLSGYYHSYSNVSVDADNDGSFDDTRDRLHTETRKLRSIWTGINAYCHYSHFIDALPEELDLYAGLSLNTGFHFEHVRNIVEQDYFTYNTNTSNQTESYQSEVEKDSYTWRPTTSTSIGVNVGARYYFKENLAANVEFGIKGRYLGIGITYKL